MIKLETLKILFNDLTREEKLRFEEWVKSEVNNVLFRPRERIDEK